MTQVLPHQLPLAQHDIPCCFSAIFIGIVWQIAAELWSAHFWWFIQRIYEAAVINSHFNWGTLNFFFFWSLLKGCFLSFSAWVSAVAKRSLITCFVLCPPDYSCDIWFQNMFLTGLLNCEWMSTVKSKGSLHGWNFVTLIFVTPPLPQYPIYVFSYSLGWQLTIIFSIDRLTHRLLE